MMLKILKELQLPSNLGKLTLKAGSIYWVRTFDEQGNFYLRIRIISYDNNVIISEYADVIITYDMIHNGYAKLTRAIDEMKPTEEEQEQWLDLLT